MTTTAPGFLKKFTAKVTTLVLILVALIVAYILYSRWTDKPWTRDGQVRAEVVKIAPRVSGYIVEVAVASNQLVHKGELLFKIDPSSFQLSVDTAQVQLDQAREDVAALEAAVKAAEAAVKAAEAMVVKSKAGMVAARARIRQQEAALANARTQSARAKRLADRKAGSVEDAQQKAATVLEIEAAVESAKAALSQAGAALSQAEASRSSSNANVDEARAKLGEPSDANVRIRHAMVQLKKAQLDLSWTTINAPFDGYITNLEVSEGQFGSAGTPIAAFVDSSSFRVDGYFQESKLKHIKPGDRAIITLMSHPDTTLKGVVDSIGYAINPPKLADTEGPGNLVPTIEPTFEWIRLAQRVPVRIRLEEIPEDLHLVSGMTASVSIQK